MDPRYDLKGEELQSALLARDRNKTCRTCGNEEDGDKIPDECMKCGWAFRTNWKPRQEKQLVLFEEV